MIQNGFNNSEYVLKDACKIKQLLAINPDFANFPEVVDLYGPAFFEKSVLDWVDVQKITLDLGRVAHQTGLTPENK